MPCCLYRLALLCAVASFARAQTTLSDAVQAITHEPAVSRAHWGVSVLKLDGTPVFGLNEGNFFIPASNAKLFTTATAMALLGPDATFQTEVSAHGDRKDAATLRGDLILHGEGDANLSGRNFPWARPVPRAAGAPAPTAVDPLRCVAELADQIAATGLKHVTGDVVGDDTLFPYEPYPEDWTIDDAVWGYGAPVSALTINDNQLVLTMSPGRKAGDAIAIALLPAMQWYTLDTRDARTGEPGSGSHLDVTRMPGSRSVRIYGTIASDAAPDAEEIAIDDPAAYAAAALRQMLAARGVQVDGVARAQHRPVTRSLSFAAASRRPVLLPEEKESATVKVSAIPQNCGLPDNSCDVAAATTPVVSSDVVLAKHTSPTLGQDVMLTNKISQNLHAELLLHQLGAVYGDGSTIGGARVVSTWLIQRARVDAGDFMLYDGSGLSGHDLVTPRAITQLLRYAAMQPWGAAWKASFPVAGEDGTLRGRFANAPMKDHLFAKTGTLAAARGLSGYVDCASGQTLIFSILVDNHAPHTNDDQKAMDRIAAAIAVNN